MLQALNSNNMPQPQQTQAAVAVHLPQASTNNGVVDYAQYTQAQFQAALAQYPAWLQKEFLRRRQRQLDELNCVEDPKIRHWSAICPRDNDKDNKDNKDKNTNTIFNDDKKTNNDTNINKNGHSNDENINTNNSNHNSIHFMVSESPQGRSSCEYLSESAACSPPPYAYSPHHKHLLEQTSSPHQNSKFLYDTEHEQPPSPVASAAVSSTNPTISSQSRSSMLTCFAILDTLSVTGDKDKDEDKDEDKPQPTSPPKVDEPEEIQKESVSAAESQSVKDEDQENDGDVDINGKFHILDDMLDDEDDEGDEEEEVQEIKEIVISQQVIIMIKYILDILHREKAM